MDERVAAIRSFNRTVTQRVGALHDHYLSRGRPLGEARVLWEIGDDGCDVRTLRSRLDLDSGYLSRLLRSLEDADLVTVGSSAADGRVRTARLTPTGRRERAELDQRSEALARSLLDPLTNAQRDRLVGAMAEVERLLTAALVDVEAVDPGSPGAQHCLREYFAELDRRFAAGFDTAVTRHLPADVFLLATLRDEPVGCGALTFHHDQPGRPAELKRMWVAPVARRLGVGRRLLAALEAQAAEAGSGVVRLDTNGTLAEAIAMYQAAGYHEVPAFNDEPYAQHWFEKRL